MQHPGAAATQQAPAPLVMIDDPGGLSKTEKDRLFDLYLQTYLESGVKSLVLSKHDFMDRLESRYDRMFIERNPDGDIRNAMLCRVKGNRNGCKVCLLFGGGTADDRVSRVLSLGSLLKDSSKHVYIEASGPIAAHLLRDKEIPVAISLEVDLPDSLHYSSKKTRYGKKVVFGNSRSARLVSPDMREFYALLYDYNRLKMKLDSNLARPQETAVSLIKLFDTVASSKIPSFYKAVLSNKISNKLSAVEDAGDGQNARRRDILELSRNLPVDWEESLADVSENLSDADRENLAVLLNGKRDKIFGEPGLQWS